MTCKKAQEFLEHHDVNVKQITDANKEKQGREQALTLARGAQKIIVAKGKKIVTFDMKDRPDDELLLSHLLGPTGNLRAPTVKVGKTLYVGFNEEAYQALAK